MRSTGDCRRRPGRRSTRATRTQTVLILIIAGGPDKGRIYELTDGEPIVLGREGDQVKLNDRKVSREHARLWTEGGQWYLKDLGSRHGTYRNHVELERGQHTKLKDGDYLQIGNTVMVLGRMPAGQIEKMALLEGASTAPKRGRAMLAVAGVSVAALLGLGGYLAAQLDALRSESVPRGEFVKLQEQLIQAQQQQADAIQQSINQQSGVSQKLLSQQQRLTASLDDTTRVIEGHGNAVAQATNLLGNQTSPILEKLEAVALRAGQQEEAIAKIGQMLTRQQSKDKSSELLAAVGEMKALLVDQPKADELLAKLDEAVASNAQAAGEAVRTALAEHREEAGAAPASAKSTEQLLTRVLEGLSQVPTRKQIAEEVRLAVAERAAKDEQFMRLVLAELRKTGEQIATDVTAAVGDDAGQAQTLMAQVVAELSKRPTGEQLAAQLSQAMEQTIAKRDSEQQSDQLTALMKQVLDELEQRPTSEQLAVDLRRAIGEDAQRTELLVARVLKELDSQPTAQQIAQELQATDNETAAKAASILEQLLAKVDDQREISDEIALLRKQIESIPGTETQSIRQVLARLDQQDKNNTEMLKAIVELRQAMPEDLPRQLDKVLAQLDEQVRTQQITDTIETTMQRIAAKQNAQTEAALEALSKRIDALPNADQLAKFTENQQTLAKLLDESDARDVIAELRSSLQSLAKQVDSGPDSEISKIITMLEKREKAELLLAELHDAMGKQSAETEALKQELRSAIKSIDQPETAQTLRNLLATVQNRILTEDSVRQAIRDEMRGKVLPNQMGLADARDVTTTAPSQADGDSTTGPSVPSRRLTQLEAAYKRSFETDQPVTVGAGVVDPNTGQVSKGRLIDPTIAKTLGYTSWRDWYLADRHAELMRTQQEALRLRNREDAKSNPGTIKLPS